MQLTCLLCLSLVTCSCFLLHTVEEAFAAINYSVKSGQSAQATLHALQSEFAGLIENIREDCAEEYLAALRKAQDEKQEVPFEK